MIELTNKRIVVTGGAGFIGSAVVSKLKERGCTKIYMPRSKVYNLTKVEDVVRVYQEFVPEVVIHLAGKSGGIGAEAASPAEFFYDNIVMGLNMIHQGNIFGLEKFVTIGTAASYPDHPYSFPFKEEEIWDGYPEKTSASYSLAKKILIVQTQAYQQQFGFRAANLILTNIYGPESRLMGSPQLVIALVKKFVDNVEEVVVWGTGNATRDLLYVDDCAEAIVLATEKCETLEPINIGSGVEVSIKYLAELIAGLAGFKGRIVWDSSQPEGQLRRCLDISRAKSLLGWSPEVSLDEGIQKTIEWYKSQIKCNT